MSNTDNAIPATLKAAIYPNAPGPQFPEMVNARYDPNSAILGVSFSGGGPRAFCCAHGQMAAIASAGLLSDIGAISCVSGGTWFGSLFSYADSSISDADLFGPITTADPGTLTQSKIGSVPSDCLLWPVQNANNENILISVAAYELLREIDGDDAYPWSGLYSFLVNSLFCLPFALADAKTSYTIDGVMGASGTSLNDVPTYKLRADRPFLIANATLLWPYQTNDNLQRFEFTSLYSGMTTEIAANPTGSPSQNLGYGYVESFAFNSSAPTGVVTDGVIVDIDTPSPLPVISDAMGSSSAAFGAFVAGLAPSVSGDTNPAYNYWSPLDNGSGETAERLQIVDGGILENTGVVGLLLRGYPMIIACVNSEYPLNSTSDACVDGVAGEVSQLFGYNAPCVTCSQADVQVFESAEFKSILVPGLNAAKVAGDAVIASGIFNILDGNVFGVDPSLYPNGVGIIWVYNDIVPAWVSALPSDVSDLLSQTTSTNNFTGFPNLATVGQNEDAFGIDEIIYYTPEQVNLLANMWYYGLNGSLAFQDAITGLKSELAL